MKLGVAFDFDVTSTGASGGRQSVEIIGLEIPKAWADDLNRDGLGPNPDPSRKAIASSPTT